ncbi:hypothetical protein BPNPMPFG_002472 [Mesorhizobium sp. AR07]|uniref:hypothetical protein n=1 Tax=Mesorhizobium sp. AR07 TaxID=2865838 RepID=UPI00215F0F3E|nr:hypothetical protein [Mesorhizobium sp. AR07]UVK46764.1 hypothetical protein BPNPMPFG_002472 [Mesorhizobium sp. AR07]
MIKFLAATVATFAGGFALASSAPAVPAVPVYQIEVTTFDGQLFIAGRGDDCRAAWQGAVIPKGWTEIVCVEAGSNTLFPFPIAF